MSNKSGCWFLMFFGAVWSFVAAWAAEIRFDPATAVVPVGGSIQVKVIADFGGDAAAGFGASISRDDGLTISNFSIPGWSLQVSPQSISATPFSFGGAIKSGETTRTGVTELATFKIFSGTPGVYELNFVTAKTGAGTASGSDIALSSFLKGSYEFSDGARRALNITSNPANGGVVTTNPLPGSDGKYPDGTLVTLTASPSSNFAFDSWSGAVTGTNNPTSITLDSDKVVTAKFRSDGSGSGSTHGKAIERMETNVTEEQLPSILNTAEPTPIPTGDRIYLRLISSLPVDPSTVTGAIIYGGEVLDCVVEYVAGNTDNSDGWIVVTIPTSLRSGAIVTASAHASTFDGPPVNAISGEFTIVDSHSGIEKNEEPSTDIDPTIKPLPPLLSDASSAVYRIAPVGVYVEPITVRIPVSPDFNADSYEVYYYSESQDHCGWYLGENVVGWMVEDSKQIVMDGGVKYLEFEVRHSGVVQLGRTINVNLGGLTRVDVGIDGRIDDWAILLGVLSAAAVLHYMSARKRRTGIGSQDTTTIA